MPPHPSPLSASPTNSSTSQHSLTIPPPHILSRLICPQCKDYLQAPVKQCAKCEATICGSCYTLSKSPGACRQCLHNSPLQPNNIIDVCLGRLQFPCLMPNCTYQGRDIRDHHEVCENRTVQCPLHLYERCDWTCRGADAPGAVVRHAVLQHPANVYYTSEKVLRCMDFGGRQQTLGRNTIGEANTSEFCVLMYAFEQMFRLHFHVDHHTAITRFQVFFNGGVALAARFHYEIRFYKQYYTADELVFRSPCQLLSSHHEDQILDYENFIMVGYEVLRRYCHGNDLYIQIKLIDKNILKL